MRNKLFLVVTFIMTLAVLVGCEGLHKNNPDNPQNQNTLTTEEVTSFVTNITKKDTANPYKISDNLKISLTTKSAVNISNIKHELAFKINGITSIKNAQFNLDASIKSAEKNVSTIKSAFNLEEKILFADLKVSSMGSEISKKLNLPLDKLFANSTPDVSSSLLLPFNPLDLNLSPEKALTFIKENKDLLAFKKSANKKHIFVSVNGAKWHELMNKDITDNTKINLEPNFKCDFTFNKIDNNFFLSKINLKANLQLESPEMNAKHEVSFSADTTMNTPKVLTTSERASFAVIATQENLLIELAPLMTIFNDLAGILKFK